MSMAVDSLEATSMGATRPPPEIGEAAGGKRLNWESMLLPWELKDAEDLGESDMSMCDDHPMPIQFRNKRFEYKNRAMIEQEKATAEYKERYRNLKDAPWDAIPVPYQLGLCGGVRPFPITDDDRPFLIRFCNLALNKYNADNQGANFVFDDLVKSTVASVSGLLYHITFKAKDASNNTADAPTFRAKVWDKVSPKDAGPEVKLVRMKPT